MCPWHSPGRRTNGYTKIEGEGPSSLTTQR